MKLSNIIENKWIEVTGGANPATDPDYVYPYSHPHKIQPAGGGWYHGTTDIFLDSISKHGLDVRRSTTDSSITYGRPKANKDKFNHFTKNITTARNIARDMVQIYGGNPIILEFDFTGTSIELIGDRGDASTKAVVPASAIVKVRKTRKLRDDEHMRRGV